MEDKDMFKELLKRIIKAENKEDAIENVFYGNDGIERAFDREEISWEEYEMLNAIINKMA